MESYLGPPSLGSFGRADPCWGVLPVEESNLLFLAASNLFPDSAAKEWASSASPPLWEDHKVSHGGRGESGGRGSGGYLRMNSLHLGGSRLRLSRLGAALCCHFLLFFLRTD